jgi:hypothetical protein
MDILHLFLVGNTPSSTTPRKASGKGIVATVPFTFVGIPFLPVGKALMARKTVWIGCIFLTLAAGLRRWCDSDTLSDEWFWLVA